MKITQFIFNNKIQIIEHLLNFQAKEFDLHFIFSDKIFLIDPEIQSQISTCFHDSDIMGCSTAGEISNKKFSEQSFSICSVKLEKARYKKCSYNFNEVGNSFDVGQSIAKSLRADSLKHVFILSDGIAVNGTHLLDGINSLLDANVNVSGGLAGDGAAFQETLVCDRNNHFVPNCISAVGFYGDIQTHTASFGGWDSFGMDRFVTKSIDNVVYEIDNQPALDLYKSYLGELSKDLPGSALFFPLEMRESEDSEVLVRTILGINEADKSMTFAGNIPKGASVRLMKANVNRIIDGAEKAANIIRENIASEPQLMLMVSCVGRKLVLKQLTQDEIEAVTDQFDENTHFAGFYSYGELLKSKGEQNCKLHNQTMTLTSFSEK
jgi:hypothetical protein